MTQETPTLTELKLNPELKDAIDNSRAGGNPVLVAYVDTSNQPSLSIRGSTHAHSETQLAIWVRNSDGGILKALEAGNSKVTLLYRNTNPDQRAMITLKGKARLGTAEERDVVYKQSPDPEQEMDKDQKGSPLIIDLESVDGFMPGFRFQMRK